MKIMVLDVAAEYGGALTILKQYYEEAMKDTSNEWFFVVSTPNLKDTHKIKVLRYPWVKKSWLHRLYFDMFKSRKIIQEHKIDEVLSLQNNTIANCNISQTLYLHQPLPFSERRYKLIENYKYWIYQNIIDKVILKSIKEADKVIVQTLWMKEACLRKIQTDPNKFELKPPKINIKVKKLYSHKAGEDKLFFYPSSAAVYKNHKIIVEAVEMLAKIGVTNYKIVFTLKGDENKHIRTLYNKVKKANLPIDFIGYLTLEEVYDYYSRSILIFPSYIETFGLPMLEARMHNSPVLASDCAFSHEILDDYNRAYFFDPFNKIDLMEKLKELINSP